MDALKLQDNSSKAFVFIDTSVKNYQSLLNEIDPNATVVTINPAQNGVEQMAEVLAGRTGVESIQIISHGADGKVFLGNGVLDRHSLNGRYADDMATIKSALTNTADILIYGCDVAETVHGKAFVNAFAKATGADVAASTDITGAKALQGDWNLEYKKGDIETKAIDVPDYDGTLLTVNVQGGCLNSLILRSFRGRPGTKGAVYKYANVAIVNGVQIDVFVTVLDIVNATITDINVASPNGGNPYTLINADGTTTIVPDNVFFSPFLSTTAANGHVDFGFTFKTTTGEPITLQNFYNNSIDVDGSEFVQYGGFQSYQVGNPTDLTATPDPATGAIKFSNTNLKTYNGLILNDVGRVQTQFTSVDSLTISMGTSDAQPGGRQFGSVFAFDKFTGPSTTVTAPSVNALETLNTTPTITGTVGGTALAATDTFSVTVNGVTYAKGNPALTITGTNWSLAIPTPLALGTYEVRAVRNAALIDQTANELLVDIDTDKDGILNTRDLDDDNDGILDTVEGIADTDGDGVINRLDLDSDNDGISDLYEGSGGAGAALKDTNKDGTMTLAESLVGGATGTGDANNDGLMDVFTLPASANVVTNGDFPININGWTPNDATQVRNNNNGAVVFSGQNAATKQNTLYQDIATVAGQVYQVTYNMVYALTPGPILTLKASALNGTTELGSTVSSRDPSNLTGSQEGFTFTAQGTTTRIFFADMVFDTATADPTLDNVVVRPINASPINTDNDGVADYLDLDSDGDGIADTIEARLTAGYVPNNGVTASPDTDKDGVLAYFDTNATFGGSFIDPVNTDTNLTGVAADPKPDYIDLDSDGDGKVDATESGLPAATTDANNDGITDSIPGVSYANPDGNLTNPQTNLANELGNTTEVAYREALDTDGDGIIDSVDLDDDNDGILDTVENGTVNIIQNGDFASATGWTRTSGWTIANGTASNILGITTETISQSVSNLDLATSAGYLTFSASVNSNNPGFNTTSLGFISTLTFSINGQPFLIARNGTSMVGSFELLNGALFASGSPTTFPISFTGNSFNTTVTVKVPYFGPANAVFAVAMDAQANADDFSMDNLVLLATPRKDNDGDGIINSLDLDSDNDGISDLYESTGGTGVALKDTNKDGTISALDTAGNNADVDKDGLMDIFDADTSSSTKTADASSLGSTPINTDGDSVADFLDLDSDGDGIADTIEARPTAGYVPNNGITSSSDTDKDGVLAYFDTNATLGGTFIDPVNTDATLLGGVADSKPDYLDMDSDGDGKADVTESGLPAATTDANSDGITDSIPGVSYANPDGNLTNPQTNLANEIGDTTEVAYREALDTDSDGIINSVDLDDDNDGILDVLENNLLIPVPTGNVTSTTAGTLTATVTAGDATIVYTKTGTATAKNADGTSGGVPFVPFGNTNGSIAGFTLGSAKDNSIAAAFSSNVVGASFSIADLNSTESVSLEVYDAQGKLIQDLRPYIVYLNTASQVVTNPLPTSGNASSIVISSVARQTGVSGSFQPTTHVDFNIPFAISRIVAKVAATSPGFPQFFYHFDYNLP